MAVVLLLIAVMVPPVLLLVGCKRGCGRIGELSTLSFGNVTF
jgi:hypothetical protein